MGDLDRQEGICSGLLLPREAPMRARPIVPIVLGTLVVALAFTRASRAEPPAVDKIVALNKTAIAALTAHDNDKAKDQLMEAVVLGKENGLGMHAAMARTYVHLGVLYVDGLKDEEKGRRYFAMAQKVRSDIEVTPALASKAVMASFVAAKGTEAKTEAKAEAKPEAKTEAKVEAKPAEAKPAVAKAEPAKPAVARAEPAKPAPAAEKKKDDSAEAREREKKERAERAQLQAEKQKLQGERDQLQAEKDKLQKALAEKDKQLAEAGAREKKEREARERLEKLNQENAKLIAEAGAREKKEREARERLEKLNQENARLIAEAGAREKKEREAREKLEKERQQADARDKERKEREEKERLAREKLIEGPDLPASIPQPLFCASKDEGVAGVELHLHCVPQAQVKARAVVLHYRPSGVAHYDAVTMEHTRKGWWTAAIPASRVAGKTLQYFVEARSAKDEVAASNGKGESPNIITLRAAGEAKAAPAAAPVAKTEEPKAGAKPARRTPAAHRQKVKAAR
jgi:hypothetical protein